MSSFDFSSSLAEKKLYETSNKKKFYGSSIIDLIPNENSFKDIFYKTDEKNNSSRKSKQKLKVVSGES